MSKICPRCKRKTGEWELGRDGRHFIHCKNRDCDHKWQPRRRKK